ncbi:hypothetical protein EDD27_1104 [Nonomuraea polychroma]|uniref:Uncharacterized protein n=1 Tax=Nonomuraea polychroma TaxID=46176 RepID=A0A438LZJ2_9ACTN|nr:hypothetical protein EDD27_1104 [Nonomuraea polychroma]
MNALDNIYRFRHGSDRHTPGAATQPAVAS